MKFRRKPSVQEPTSTHLTMAIHEYDARELIKQAVVHAEMLWDAEYHKNSFYGYSRSTKEYGGKSALLDSHAMTDELIKSLKEAGVVE